MLLAADGPVLPLGGLLAIAESWRDCLAVLVPVAVGAGVPVCMPVGLRVLRGLGRGLAILVLAAVLRFFLFQVVVSGSDLRRGLLSEVLWLHSPNNLPYCAAEAGHLVGCGSTD